MKKKEEIKERFSIFVHFSFISAILKYQVVIKKRERVKRKFSFKVGPGKTEMGGGGQRRLPFRMY